MCMSHRFFFSVFLLFLTLIFLISFCCYTFVAFILIFSIIFLVFFFYYLFHFCLSFSLRIFLLRLLGMAFTVHKNVMLYMASKVLIVLWRAGMVVGYEEKQKKEKRKKNDIAQYSQLQKT